MANTIGSQLPKMPKPDIASVFLRTRRISDLVAAFSKGALNHLNPTHVSKERVLYLAQSLQQYMKEHRIW